MILVLIKQKHFVAQDATFSGSFLHEIKQKVHLFFFVEFANVKNIEVDLVFILRIMTVLI